MIDHTALPSPEHFFKMVNAFHQSAVIKGAIELDVFTAVAEGNTTVKDLAANRKTSERGMRILCDNLVIMGCLTKTDGHYGLTQDSSFFLDRRSPVYLGPTIDFLQAPFFIEAYHDIAGAVRKGGTLQGDEGSVSPENPLWVRFARAMAPIMIVPAQAMAQLAQIDQDRKFRVLDIAAGHGIFGITFAQLFPNVEVVALDWAPVLEVAKENARKIGVIERYQTLAGSAFNIDFGNDYDLILLTNFLHHFSAETCEGLLKKVRAALNAGGRVMTLDFIPNEDRVSPPFVASFSMTMLASTAGGDAYTFSEYEKMFYNAGFSRSEMHQLAPSPQQVIISHK